MQRRTVYVDDSRCTSVYGPVERRIQRRHSQPLQSCAAFQQTIAAAATTGWLKKVSQYTE